jgi:hypothetical protein
LALDPRLGHAMYEHGDICESDCVGISARLERR